jgi:pimeloyl-ACP methyl ester carboxylesterase
MRSPIDDELLDEVLSLVRRPGAGAAWQAFQRDEVRWSGPRTVFGDKLAALSCPVTLLAGEHDLVDPDAVRTAAARIPRGVFHVVQGAGHWLPRDAPDAVADQLLDLVSAIDAGPQVCPSTRYAAETQGIDHPAAKEGTGR